MVKTKGIDKTLAKWQARVSVAAPDYEDGIKNPKKDWKSEAKAAEARYEDGVRAAIAEKRFGKGVEAAGTEKWQKKAIEVGVARWAPGVAAATEDYKAGMSKVLAAIEATTLPPRYAAGDPRNYERVKAIGQAVHNAVKKK